MFGPNDFRPITSSSKMLGGIPGLNAKQELAWAQAVGQKIILTRQNGMERTWSREHRMAVLTTSWWISGIASGISGLSGAGLFGGGGAPATQGIGPVADGAAYGGMLDSMQGLGGMGPVASGATYGTFLDSPRRTSGAFGW